MRTMGIMRIMRIRMDFQYTEGLPERLEAADGRRQIERTWKERK